MEFRRPCEMTREELIAAMNDVVNVLYTNEDSNDERSA